MRRSWPVWLGLGAVCAVALGLAASGHVSTVFADVGLWSTRAVPRLLGRAAVPVGLALLVLAFALAHPSRCRVDPRLVAALWYAPLLVAPPLLSRDMYAYVDQGWLAGHVDPYTTPMGTLGPYAWLVDPFWEGTTTVYPPLALLLQRVAVDLADGRALVALLLMRVPVLASLAVVAWLAPRVAARVPGGAADPARVRWFFLLNPLTVVHLVGGGHNDAVMLALVIAGCALATTRGGYVTGSLMAGLAMAAKQPGLLVAVVVALIAFPGLPLLRRAGAAVGAVALALASFAAFSWASGLGFGWLSADGSPTKAATQSPAYLLSELVARAMGADEKAVYALVLPVSLTVLTLVLAWSWFTRHERPLLLAAVAYLAFAALGPGLQAWYPTYGLAFVAMVPVRRRWAAVLAGWGVWLLVANLLAQTWGLPNLMCAGFGIGAGALVGWCCWRAAPAGVAVAE